LKDENIDAVRGYCDLPLVILLKTDV